MRRIFTTKYNKWRPQERDILFQNLAFVDSTAVDSQLSIVKLGSSIEKSILDKFHRKPLIFTRHSVISRRFAIYYTMKCHRLFRPQFSKFYPSF
ncbi:MAG: hypothetical protein OXN25_19240, partial [Candidatus Poribacteria bacterium]|nr:hypothetical protein [Candidatus Poribacteria bacterium]